MPYIVLKRNDIPSSLLRGLDLTPSTSQRNPIYSPIGQTRYVHVPSEGVPTRVFGGTTTSASAGLCAYFQTRVSSGSGTNATSSITTVAKANLVDGDFFVLSNGSKTARFVFNVSGSYSPPPSVVYPLSKTINVSADTTANDIRDKIISTITGFPNSGVTAVIGGAATVALTNDNQNVTAAKQNATNTDGVADGGFVVTSFAGATPSTALTSALAGTNSLDVLGQMEFGNANVTAGELNLSSINTAITTGSILDTQVTDILQILTGRQYVVPAGTVVEDGGEFAGGDYFEPEGNYLQIYETGPFRISIAEGRLSFLRKEEYEYLGIPGAAVVVYDDVGTKYL